MLVPDRMAKLWQSVEAGQMSPEDCVSEQEVLLEPYRAEWTKALLCDEETDFRTSVLREIAAYYHASDSADIDRACDSAVDTLKSEWDKTVDSRQRSSVESFYETKTHIYDLMNWHTLRDDSGPLAYVGGPADRSRAQRPQLPGLWFRCGVRRAIVLPRRYRHNTGGHFHYTS